MFKTMFSLGCSSSVVRIRMPFLLVTLERATYNCPWVNTCFGRNSPTCSRDCPWLLFMVMAKHNDIGYCLRLRTNGHFDSEGDNVILGMRIFSPMLEPLITSPSTNHLPSCVIFILVPLHRPAPWLMCGGR